VLPGELPECTSTLTGAQRAVTVRSGVTCLDGATVNGAVVVRPGASLVASDTVINGTLQATGADSVQLFGTRVEGGTSLSDTTSDITIAGSRFDGALSLTGNAQVSDNERYSRLAGEYGPMPVGSAVNGALSCTGNSAEVKDFGAPNRINGAHGGDCADL
jgi:hypothetical protein